MQVRIRKAEIGVIGRFRSIRALCAEYLKPFLKTLKEYQSKRFHDVIFFQDNAGECRGARNA